MFERKCPECGVRDSYPSGAFDVVVEGGSKYPDVLGCGAYPFLILSESVINDWKDAGITAFETYPVGIAEVKSKKLQDVSAPNYYRVEFSGKCKIDLEASGFKVLNKCKSCGHITLDSPLVYEYHIVPDSWDGSPIFRDSDIFPRVIFCTELIVQLAKKNKRTNFRFSLMDQPEDFFSKGLDYLK